MILTLEIGGSEAENLGARRRKVFNATGGTIGRSPDCDWALPDQFISGRHAVIRYQGGVFFIEDADSKNGVFVNSLQNRLTKGQPHELKSGDLILIDPYEITASIDEHASPPVSARPPAYTITDDPFAPVGSRPSPVVEAADVDLDSGFAGDPSEVVDPLAWLSPSKNTPDKGVPRAANLPNKPVVSEHYTPPRSVYVEPERVPKPGGGGLIPDDWLIDSPQPAKREPPSVPRRAPEAVDDNPPPAPRRPPMPSRVPDAPAAAGGDLKAVLEGAGLSNVAVTPELARDFGAILRIVVGGLIDVLRAREEFKREFGIAHTIFKRSENNPLKHSVDADDALHNLLVKRNAAYLGPVEAFEDAFSDVRNHQMAMLAGFRAAFEAMFAEFEPGRLQAEFDKQVKKGSLIAAPAKLRYWDLYCQKIRDMVNDPDTTFREIFGEELVRAYEDQLRELKARGDAPKRQQT